MKKHILAAAVAAAVAAPAFAQSSVEIYGRLDVGYSDSSIKTTSFSIANGVATESKTSRVDYGNSVGVGASTATGGLTASRLGFRGTEDLGGGLKAKFQIETDLGLNESKLSGFNNREAWVGIAGNFGEIRTGTQYTPGFDAGLAADLTGANQIVGNWGKLYGNTAYASGASNSIRYFTPSISGFTANLMVFQDNSKVDGVKTNSSGNAFGLDYSNGPLRVYAAQVNNSAKNEGGLLYAANTLFRGQTEIAASGNDPQKSTRSTTHLGVNYNAGVAQVGAMWFTRSAKDTLTDLSAQNDLDIELNNDLKVKRPGSGYRLTVAVPLGAVTLLGAYLDMNETSKSTDEDGQENFRQKLNRTATQLGATYSFSKRTRAYAFVGNQKDKYKVRFESATVTGQDSVTENQVAIGIRHDF